MVFYRERSGSYLRIDGMPIRTKKQRVFKATRYGRHGRAKEVWVSLGYVLKNCTVMPKRTLKSTMNHMVRMVKYFYNRLRKAFRIG